MQTIIDTQQRILDSARELIFSRSYADVGVAAICEHAGVKKGSFYHFFPSKQALTIAILDAQFDDTQSKMIGQAFADDVPPLARLGRFVDMAYLFQKQLSVHSGRVLGCPFGNLANELSTQDEPIREKIQQTFARLQNLISGVLQAAQQAGDLAQDIDAGKTAHSMLAYFEGVMLLAKNQNDPDVIRELLPTMVQMRVQKVA
ncbi:MAG TPA: TetR/AcrR family transcriptional regulator [Thiobacillus sp.]